MLIKVALPVPLYKEFDYLPQKNRDTLPQIGSRVRVPFGRQTLIGIVIAYTSPGDIDIPANKLKIIKQTIDISPIIDSQTLDFAKWLSRYYHYPLGEVLMVMLPVFIRQGKTLDTFVSHWKITKNSSIDEISKSAHKQRDQFSLIALNGEHGASEDVLLMEGVERYYLKKLAEKGLIQHFTEVRQSPKPVDLAKLPYTLNTQQNQSVEKIINAYKKNTYQGFLLNGVTGSGKTEVYLQAMHPILEDGKQVLVLVPEIGLTPQTKARFSERFVANILLLHSGINDSSRMQGWEDCKQGHAQIIIGTRSTLLYPFKNLGLIIVDEAHDTSYKQQDSLRYQACDVALYRGLQLNIPVVLGTATPTLEQYKLVADGKLIELTLTQRAGHAKPPVLKLIDSRKNSGKKNNYTTSYTLEGKLKEENTGLTSEVIDAIHKTLESGEQVLIFLNRRGYAPVLLCGACGWQADCPHCDSHLTIHAPSNIKTNSQSSQYNYLKCHHCGWQSSLPNHCPDCHSSNLDPVGVGTTRLSNLLHSIFSNPQTSKHTYPIIQIDKDTTRLKGSWENIYRQINQGHPSILIGTQMIAKGHHFPKVTLVVIPNADSGFLSADFRSPEHTAQLIMQVAGRAGRSKQAGTVMIQTIQPENPLLKKLVSDGYHRFAQQLMAERKMMGLPPYTYAGLLRCEGKSQDKAHQALKDALTLLNKLDISQQLAISGVIDAPMAKKNGRYHSQILLLAKQRSILHNTINQWWHKVKELPSARYLKLSLDIDPIGW